MNIPAEHREMLRQLQQLQPHIKQLASKFGIRATEDVVQEVSLRCIQSSKAINWLKDQSAWVMTVTRNIVIDLSRRCRVRREICDIEATVLEDRSIRPRPDIEETRPVVIHQAIDRLRPSIRMAIRAKFWDHRPDEDVAHELGVTAPAVRQMRSRGLKQIKVALCRQQLGDLCD